jgi:hypothetical protein
VGADEWLVDEVQIKDDGSRDGSSISFAKAVTEIRFKHKGIHLFT